MAKVKALWRDLPLRKSIALCILAFAVLAVALSTATAALCNEAALRISERYPVTGEKYYLTNEDGERLGEGTYIYKDKEPLSRRDERLTTALNVIPVVATPLYSALCVMAAALLVYRSKMKEPLARLRAASEKISNNDLDFKIEYAAGDELGQLCASFETMRAALAENFAQMWRQIEERRRLNAAFAHELRTPLTVLKGYGELLETSGEAQTRETAETMKKHIGRMERYLDGMSRLRRLEDAEPEYREIAARELAAALRAEAEMLCTRLGKGCAFRDELCAETVCVDAEMVSEVLGNLVANAARYARADVRVLCAEEDGGLTITVEDDGPGFSARALRDAAAPYFTEEGDSAEHFGLGLTICKLLCERHGGRLEIENSPAGAKVSACFPFSEA